MREFDIALKCGGNKVTVSVLVHVDRHNEQIKRLHDQVDASDLVHEVHAIGKENTSTSLHFISLEDLAPSVELFVSNCYLEQ